MFCQTAIEKKNPLFKNMDPEFAVAKMKVSFHNSSVNLQAFLNICFS